MIDEEGRRCWTLQYSENLNFHMDILPAIPFNEGYRRDIRLNEAYNSMSNKRELALLATDKNEVTSQYDYIPTNPRGYAEWSKGRMQINKSLLFFNSIERVPEYPIKTILQKAIQILKRHRDVYFENKDDSLKPISMIITTLVAKSYHGEEQLYEFICKALGEIKSLIKTDLNGNYVIKNPVMGNENFADKWKEQPKKADAIFEWVKKARFDFFNLEPMNTYNELEKALKKLFSQKSVDRLMEKYKLNLQQQREFASTIVDKSNSIVVYDSIPHKRTPPLVMPYGFTVQIKGQASFNIGKTYEKFASGSILPKEVGLQFFPLHSIVPSYKVKWQITNTGIEARNVACLRGNKFEDSELCDNNGVLSGKQESTAYTGQHFV